MASTTTVPVSKNAIVSILKDLPENMLADIFWKTFVSDDDSALNRERKKIYLQSKRGLQKKRNRTMAGYQIEFSKSAAKDYARKCLVELLIVLFA